MVGRRLWATCGAVALAVIGLFTFETGAAQTVEARWSTYTRADTVSFAPGETPIEVAGAGAGYEIVSFAAAGLADAFETYMYGGADLPAEHGGPMPPILACASTFTPTELFLRVEGAYPFAGCLFFVGVSNTGSESVRVHLGTLDEQAQVTCDSPGCEVSDVEVVAGAPAPGEGLDACEVDGAANVLEGPVISLAPASTLVCPVFVIVLQPAAENATYTIIIEPPALETDDSEVLTFDPGPNPPGLTNAPPPAVVDDPPPGRDPDAETPTNVVEGERTPGPGPTPAPPATGSAALVQRHAETHTSWMAGILFGVAIGVLAAAFRSTPERYAPSGSLIQMRPGMASLLIVIGAGIAAGLVMTLLRMT